MLHFYFLVAIFYLQEVILYLLCEPAFWCCIKCYRKSHCHFWAYACMTIQQFRKRLPAYTKSLCRLCNRYPQRLNAKLFDNLSRMRRIVHHNFTPSLSVIVQIVNINNILFFKPKDNPPVTAYVT